MAYVALFIVLAVLEILSATLIFMFKDILHAVLGFSLVFVFNSALFFVLQQPFLALVQLLIMVGGVSTYVFVGVGSASYSKFKHTNYTILAISYAAIFLTFIYKLTTVTVVVPEANLLSSEVMAQAFTSNIGFLYAITGMLFAVGFSSIIIMRKLSGKK